MKHRGECTTGSKRVPVVVIAAHAVSLGVTLVINNEADFHGFAGLVVQNWVKDHCSGRAHDPVGYPFIREGISCREFLMATRADERTNPNPNLPVSRDLILGLADTLKASTYRPAVRMDLQTAFGQEVS